MTAWGERQSQSLLKSREVLAKAKELNGLSMEETAVLVALEDRELIEEVFSAARAVKEEIYGSRLVFFAPLYTQQPVLQ